MVGAFLQKIRKIFFFAVQIENTEINILQKEWLVKLFLLFNIKRKKYFWISLTPDGALTN